MTINCVDNSTARESLKTELKEQIQEYLEQTGLKGDYEVSLAVKDFTESAKRKRFGDKKANIAHVAKLNSIMNQIDSHSQGKKWGAISLIDTDPFQQANVNGNYSVRKAANTRLLYSEAPELAELRDTWSANVKGLVNWSKADKKLLNEELINHWSGKGTKDAKALMVAKAWDKLSKRSLIQIRANGGSVGEIADYKPNGLDWEKLFEGGVFSTGDIKVSRTQFVDDLFPAIDRTKPNPQTGLPWKDTELKSALSTYYQTLINGGRKPGSKGFGTGGLQVANGQSRIFHYTNDGWGEVMSKYGHDDIVSGLFKYVDNVSSDIAELQVFGPKPNSMRTAITQHLNENNEGKASDWLEQAWDIASGRNSAAPHNRTVARVSSTTRSAASIMQLGNAFISSLLGDNRNVLIRSIANDSSFLRWIDLRLRNITNSKDQAEFISEQMIATDTTFQSLTAAFHRLGQSGYVKGAVSDRLGKVLNASGLGSITENARQSLELNLQATLAKHLNKTFVQLENDAPDLAIKLREWGVDSVWDDISKTSKTKSVQGFVGSYDLLDMKHLFDTNETAWEKITQYIVGESRMGVITSNIHGESLLQLQSRAGTVGGEFARFGSQYLKFPASAFYGIWKPVFQGAGTRPVTRLKMASSLMMLPFLLGTLDIWSRQLASGQSPEPLIDDNGDVNVNLITKAGLKQDLLPFVGIMALNVMGFDDPKKLFSLFEGGEYGDRVTQFKAVSRLAPATSMLFDVGHKVVYEPAKALFTDPADLPNATGRALTELVKIGGSAIGLQLWYTKLLYKELILNNIEEMFDSSEFNRRQRRRDKYLKENGQVDLF